MLERIMNDFETRILNAIKNNNLIKDGDVVVVGFSGGPDSTTLLHVLNKIRTEKIIDFNLIAAHINHGLRENAILDEEFVKEYCDNRGIPLFIKHADVKQLAQDNKRGLEDMGRIVRYEFFEEVANNNDANVIAIAHNKKDSVETMLMNIFRGCGLTGLRGIEIKDGKYIRPLINENRSDIEDYLATEGIKPRIDESNSDNTYTRNRIRNIVIPSIEKDFNPSFIESMRRLADIVKESDDYVNKISDEAFNNILISQKGEEIVLNRKKFNELDTIIQKKIIMKAIQSVTGTTKGIEKVNLEDIIKLCNNNVGNKYLMPNKNVKVELKDKNIYIQKK